MLAEALNEPDIVSEFESAGRHEAPTKRLSNVYKTGVMFEDGTKKVELNNTSLGLTEGRILWSLARKLRPETIIETGFGRGGSAAFLLAAVHPWGGKVRSVDPAFRHWAGETGSKYLQALVLCTKLESDERDWCHFKPFVSSPKADWDVHGERPDAATVPNATFS